jgi:hypothetical protein
MHTVQECAFFTYIKRLFINIFAEHDIKVIEVNFDIAIKIRFITIS